MKDIARFIVIWVATVAFLYLSLSFIELSVSFHDWYYATRVIFVVLTFFDMYISGYIVSRME